MTGSTGREQSVAVLPFENLGNESGNAYFADGFPGEKCLRQIQIYSMAEHFSAVRRCLSSKLEIGFRDTADF